MSTFIARNLQIKDKLSFRDKFEITTIRDTNNFGKPALYWDVSGSQPSPFVTNTEQNEWKPLYVGGNGIGIKNGVITMEHVLFLNTIALSGEGTMSNPWTFTDGNPLKAGIDEALRTGKRRIYMPKGEYLLTQSGVIDVNIEPYKTAFTQDYADMIVFGDGLFETVIRSWDTIEGDAFAITTSADTGLVAIWSWRFQDFILQSNATGFTFRMGDHPIDGVTPNLIGFNGCQFVNMWISNRAAQSSGAACFNGFYTSTWSDCAFTSICDETTRSVINGHDGSVQMDINSNTIYELKNPAKEGGHAAAVFTWCQYSSITGAFSVYWSDANRPENRRRNPEYSKEGGLGACLFIGDGCNSLDLPRIDLEIGGVGIAVKNENPQMRVAVNIGSVNAMFLTESLVFIQARHAGTFVRVDSWFSAGIPYDPEYSDSWFPLNGAIPQEVYICPDYNWFGKGTIDLGICNHPIKSFNSGMLMFKNKMNAL